MVDAVGSDLETLLRAARDQASDERTARAAGRNLALAVWRKAKEMPEPAAARFVIHFTNDPVMTADLSGPAWEAFDETIGALQHPEPEEMR